jgi:hypothetical protein
MLGSTDMTTNPMNKCQTKSPLNIVDGSGGFPVSGLQSDTLPDPAILTPEERSREFSRIMLRAIQRRRARRGTMA